MSELQVAKRHCINKMRADATIIASIPSARILQNQADEDTVMPYILVSEARPGADLMGVGIIRIKTDVFVLVKVVAPGASFKDYEALIDRVDAVLHGSRGPVTGGGNVVACVRELPVAYVEVNEGAEFIHFGAVYWIQAQQ